MSQPGTFSAALAFVPNWWQDTADPFALDALLGNWAKACGWRACGVVLPVENSAPIVKTNPGGATGDAAPVEVPDALRRIRGGESTVLYSAPGTAGRVFAGVQSPGQPMGLIWAERPAGQAWGDNEREYLVLTGKALERSPALAAVIGPVTRPGPARPAARRRGRDRRPDGPRLRQHPDRNHRVLGPDPADAPARFASRELRRGDRARSGSGVSSSHSSCTSSAAAGR